MYSTQYIIDIANLCVPIVIQAIEKGVEQDTTLPRKILMCAQSVQDYYTDDPTNEFLPLTSNYLWAICGGYAFQAQDLYGGSGGIVVPPSSGGGSLTPYPINIEVQPSQAGGSTLSALIPTDWVGLIGVVECTIDQNILQLNSQFSYNEITGVFDFSLYGLTVTAGMKFTVNSAFKQA